MISNASASSFFATIEDALWENVLLHLARLTDPPLTAGKANLTLARLPALVDQQIAVEVTQLWDEVVAATQFPRDWRNRRIAHTDLALRFNQSAAPLTPASRADVSKALTAIATLLNRVESHYRGSTVVYDAPGPFGGAERLLYVLHDGLKAEAERQKRLESGQYNAEDFNHEV